MEANSYKRSAHEEYLKNEDFLSLLNKLKRDKNHLQNNFKTYLNEVNNLKDEHSKLMQMTEFQNQNLDQVIIVHNK